MSTTANYLVTNLPSNIPWPYPRKKVHQLVDSFWRLRLQMPDIAGCHITTPLNVPVVPTSLLNMPFHRFMYKRWHPTQDLKANHFMAKQCATLTTQPITGETFPNGSAFQCNIGYPSWWLRGRIFERAFFLMRGFLTPSNKLSTPTNHTKSAREIEYATFTPLVMSSTWSLGQAASTINKRPEQPYNGSSRTAPSWAGSDVYHLYHIQSSYVWWWQGHGIWYQDIPINLVTSESQVPQQPYHIDTTV